MDETVICPRCHAKLKLRKAGDFVEAVEIAGEAPPGAEGPLANEYNVLCFSRCASNRGGTANKADAYAINPYPGLSSCYIEA